MAFARAAGRVKRASIASTTTATVSSTTGAARALRQGSTRASESGVRSMRTAKCRAFARTRARSASRERPSARGAAAPLRTAALETQSAGQRPAVPRCASPPNGFCARRQARSPPAARAERRRNVVPHGAEPLRGCAWTPAVATATALLHRRRTARCANGCRQALAPLVVARAPAPAPTKTRVSAATRAAGAASACRAARRFALGRAARRVIAAACWSAAIPRSRVHRHACASSAQARATWKLAKHANATRSVARPGA
jgi:hypothetical protein